MHYAPFFVRWDVRLYGGGGEGMPMFVVLHSELNGCLADAVQNDFRFGSWHCPSTVCGQHVPLCVAFIVGAPLVVCQRVGACA
jgi:hypothetical protein